MKVRWEFLRKGSKFERTVKSRDPLLKKIISYPELNEIFGDEWIETQKNLGFFPFIHQRLADLESSITDVKHLSGFNKWVTNITSNPLEFYSYEFEILEFSRMSSLADHMEIYPPIDKGDLEHTPLSELRILRNNIEFYIEMSKLRSISNPKNKIERLIKKGKRQIPKNSVGFIFTDVSDITLKEYNYIDDDGRLIWEVKSNLEVLDNEVDQFFRGKNTRILGVAFNESYLISDEKFKIGIYNQHTLVPNKFNKLKLDDIQIKNLIFPTNRHS